MKSIYETLMGGFQTIAQLFDLPMFAPTDHSAYHSDAHCIDVACLAGAIYLHEVGRWECNPNTLRNLVLAGMYHDADHTKGSGYNDDVNIERAQQAFKNSHFYNTIGEANSREVLALIGYTRYPYSANVIMVEVNCLRDADLLAAIFRGQPDAILTGLRKELQTHADIYNKNIEWTTIHGIKRQVPASDYGRIEACESQISFCQGMILQTKTGQELRNHLKDEWFNLLKTAATADEDIPSAVSRHPAARTLF